jgi:hypothetical protein
MTSARFEPVISAGERPQTNALNREATGIGLWKMKDNMNFSFKNCVRVRGLVSSRLEQEI